jgi:hypothetical protein
MTEEETQETPKRIMPEQIYKYIYTMLQDSLIEDYGLITTMRQMAYDFSNLLDFNASIKDIEIFLDKFKDEYISNGDEYRDYEND